ncbi:hypothetical protein [Oceanobacillus sp. CAU 1775]
MGLALKKEYTSNGIAREDVQVSLQRLTKKINQVEETLKNRFDNEIWKLVQLEEEKIKHVEKHIASIIQYK